VPMSDSLKGIRFSDADAERAGLLRHYYALYDSTRDIASKRHLSHTPLQGRRSRLDGVIVEEIGEIVGSTNVALLCSAGRMRTPMACCDNIFRKAPTFRCTRKPIGTKWLVSSNDHVRPCNLKPQQRDLTPVLRRPVEPAGQKTDICACARDVSWPPAVRSDPLLVLAL
jgi:hypothetical protein